MRKVTLYIAASVDGYIADKHHSTDWLQQIPGVNNENYGYDEFLKNIDIIVMGNNTYKQVNSFDMDYPYSNKPNIIVSGTETKSSIDYIEYCHPGKISGRIRSYRDENIWLVGGGQLNSLFLENNLINEIVLFIAPVVIGKGIKLFEGYSKSMTKMRVVDKKSYSSGMQMIKYFIS